MTNLVPSTELHATEAGRPLLHHSPTTGQSISSSATVDPILETILILEWAQEQLMLGFAGASQTKKKNYKIVSLTASSVILKFS